MPLLSGCAFIYFTGYASFLRRARDLWTGKIVLDCNNGPVPADFNYPVSAPSYTEKYQLDIPGSKVVKAFNANAQELYDHERILRQTSVIGLMAGDDSEAKQTVAVLLRTRVWSRWMPDWPITPGNWSLLRTW